MNNLAAALLERRFPLADAAAALSVPAAVLQLGAGDDGAIPFRRAVRLALAHHRTLAYAVRGPRLRLAISGLPASPPGGQAGRGHGDLGCLGHRGRARGGSAGRPSVG